MCHWTWILSNQVSFHGNGDFQFVVIIRIIEINFLPRVRSRVVYGLRIN